jgi:hypothetical protein
VFGFPGSAGIYLAATPVDMRNSIDGLAAIVRNQWKENVYCGRLFAYLSNGVSSRSNPLRRRVSPTSLEPLGP